MEKKSTKGLIVLAVVFIALFLLLLVFVAILIFGWFFSRQSNGGNAGPFIVEDTDSDTGTETQEQTGKETEPESDLFGVEVTKESETQGDGITIVVSGFQFQIPSDYSCTYAEGIGPVIYMDDVFQMKLGVRSDSYEEAIQNPDTLTEKTVAAGGTILQEVREASLNGKNYAYFRMELSGDNCFVVYTASPDAGRQLAGQIVMESELLTDEDMLNVFASIAETAQETDQPDSTLEDIMAQLGGESVKPGEEKESSSMSYSGETVMFGVTDNFYSMGAAETDIYMQETFLRGDFAVMVDCYLWTTTGDNALYENAEAYIASEWDWLYDNVKDSVEIKTVEIEGNSYCYFIVHYELDGSDYQRIYAACDTGSSGIYSITARVVDEDMELTLETVYDFLVLY